METGESWSRVRQPRGWQKRNRHQDRRTDTGAREPLRGEDPAPPDGKAEPAVPSGPDPAATRQPLAVPDLRLPQRGQNGREPTRPSLGQPRPKQNQHLRTDCIQIGYIEPSDHTKALSQSEQAQLIYTDRSLLNM